MIYHLIRTIEFFFLESGPNQKHLLFFGHSSFVVDSLKLSVCIVNPVI